MELSIAGDVRTVLDGVADTHSREVDLSKIPFALGAGKFSEKEFGEMIVVEGIAYVHTVAGKKRYDKTVDTPFVMGFEKLPSDRVERGQGESLDEIYRDLLTKYPQGVVLYGEVHFRMLNAAFLKKSPVFHEKCNEMKEAYWEEYSEKGAAGSIVGILAKEAYPQGFYVNPNEQSDLLSHSHTLVNGVAYHLLNQSTIEDGIFYISPIDSMRLIS